MNGASAMPAAGRYWALVAITAPALLLLALPTSAAIGWILLALFAILAWRQQLFELTGFACIAALYYWVGIANPFDADVHGVTIGRELARDMTGIVVVGLASFLAGGFAARWLANASAETSRELDYGRLYRAASVCMGLGLLAVVLVYARYGAPALQAIPDVAREEVSTQLSPYTQYQWLLIDAAICLTAIGLARDHDPLRRSRRIALAALSAAAALLLALYASRILVAAPLIAGLIAWTTQGRRIPPRVMGIAVLGAIAVISVGWLARVSAVGTFTLYNVDFDLSGGWVSGLVGLAAATTIFARTSIEVFALFVSGQLPKLGGEVALMSVLAVLPGHQRELGLFRVTRLLGYEGATGTTISLFGGMYADFGVPGVLIESALVGGLLGYLGRGARGGDGLGGVYYAICFTYFVANIYGGVVLDVTLLWKLWIAALVVHWVRRGSFSGIVPTAAVLATGAVYVYGLFQLVR